MITQSAGGRDRSRPCSARTTTPSVPKAAAPIARGRSSPLAQAAQRRAAQPLSRIAFGSCATQARPQPIWNAVAATQPELILLLGDNIYGDTEDMDVMRAKYAKFAAMPGFKALRETVPILATWDDHDLGVNDGGSDYPKKVESQKVFLDFFGDPDDSPRRKRPGVYDAKVFGPEGKRVQVIMLDTRYFRSSPLKRKEPRQDGASPMSAIPTRQPRFSARTSGAGWGSSSAAGRDPADRVEHPGHRRGPRLGEVDEPAARARAALQPDPRAGAEGVVFLSGDRHLAELSTMDGGAGYPFYDVTSSGLNQAREVLASAGSQPSPGRHHGLGRQLRPGHHRLGPSRPPDQHSRSATSTGTSRSSRRSA